MKNDPVNHPYHYTQGMYEVIDVITDWKLNFALGNVIKYVARAKHRGKELEDLRKAAWYLNYQINELVEAERDEDCGAKDPVHMDDPRSSSDN